MSGRLNIGGHGQPGQVSIKIIIHSSCVLIRPPIVEFALCCECYQRRNILEGETRNRNRNIGVWVLMNVV